MTGTASISSRLPFEHSGPFEPGRRKALEPSSPKRGLSRLSEVHFRHAGASVGGVSFVEVGDEV